MKIKTLSKLLIFTLAAVLGSSRLTAQTFTTVYDFPNVADAVNLSPVAGLVLSGNLLYGATYYSGTNGVGMVFAINTNGTGFAALHTFSPTAFNSSGPDFTNSDGAGPVGLVLSGNMLYGVTSSGGTNGAGTVFALGTNGTGFATLHTFNSSKFDPNIGNSTNLDGAGPKAGLVLSSSGTLYGTTYNAGTNGFGTVFAINTDGSGFATLHNFNGGATASKPGGDGGNPASTLILSGGTLYGTTQAGGTNGWGEVFALNTNGLGFATLHNFTPYVYDPGSGTYVLGGDGANPEAGLVLSGNTLYGTTTSGGTNDTGMVFAVNINGLTSAVLYDFSATNGASANSDGAYPESALAVYGNTLYGTTVFGGANGNGTVFAVSTSGTGFQTLYNFNPLGEDSFLNFTNYGGANPKTGLVLSGSTLFGTANGGGSYGGQYGDGGGIYGGGTVYSLAVTLNVSPIPLTEHINAPNLVLTWSDPSFILQSAAKLPGPWTTVPGAANPYNAALTNPMQFFRLVHTNSP